MEQQRARDPLGARRGPAAGWAEAERGTDRVARVRAALEDARARLLELQHEDGHWCAELEGDTILESEYIMVMQYLGESGSEKLVKAANYIRGKQLPEGGWAAYPGGPAEVSASVKAYFVLKLLGDEPGAPHMERARRAILELGGLDACNSYTKIYLSVFGQYDWKDAPAVPPEIVLLPKWFPLNLYEMSSWSRAIVVPLSILWALKPTCPVPEGAMIDELRNGGPVRLRPAVGGETGRLWAWFFLAIDLLIKLVERLGFRPFRRRALEAAERWIVERLDKSDGLGAIFPPIVNCLYAFDALGHPRDGELMRSQLAELERLEIEEGDTLRLQPCFSSVWDTCQALSTLAETDLPADDPRLIDAASWILDREVTQPGDWRVKNPDGPVGGFYFEYANEFYPDCDDTAEILLAFSKLQWPREVEGRARAAEDRAERWLLSMQNRDGGWASFDKGCDKEWLTTIPFADHNAMIDPSTADITARVLEALAGRGFGRDHPAVVRAVDYLLDEQEPEGCWFGRWGCNYLYGTWLALWGLRAIGEEPGRQDWGWRAADWIRAHQNDDGGWGELPASYDDPAAKGRGPSTAAQTAWALMGLIAAGDLESEAVGRGLDYLIETQRADGGWIDSYWTGTGFPRVFYLNYHYYALYFPLLALAVWDNERRARRGPRMTVA